MFHPYHLEKEYRFGGEKHLWMTGPFLFSHKLHPSFLFGCSYVVRNKLSCLICLMYGGMVPTYRRCSASNCHLSCNKLVSDPCPQARLVTSSSDFCDQYPVIDVQLPLMPEPSSSPLIVCAMHTSTATGSKNHDPPTGYAILYRLSQCHSSRHCNPGTKVSRGDEHLSAPMSFGCNLGIIRPKVSPARCLQSAHLWLETQQHASGSWQHWVWWSWKDQKQMLGA